MISCIYMFSLTRILGDLYFLNEPYLIFSRLVRTIVDIITFCSLLGDGPGDLPVDWALEEQKIENLHFRLVSYGYKHTKWIYWRDKLKMKGEQNKIASKPYPCITKLLSKIFSFPNRKCLAETQQMYISAEHELVRTLSTQDISQQLEFSQIAKLSK